LLDAERDLEADQRQWQPATEPRIERDRLIWQRERADARSRSPATAAGCATAGGLRL